MFPFWLILGMVTILMGIFNRQILRILGLKPMSEGYTAKNLMRSAKIVEQIGQWLVITLGISFLFLGLGATLPGNTSYKISLAWLGLSGLMLLVMIGITIANWRAR